MISTAQFKNGIAIVMDGNLYQIVDFQHVKPGKGGAFVRTKLKNIKTGAVIDKTFRSGEDVEDAHVDKAEVQYLYNDGDSYHFMDTESYEQFELGKDMVSDAARFLVESSQAYVTRHNGEPIGIEPPMFVELSVTETEPGFKGNTQSGTLKPAILETGATIQVPLFVEIGDKIKIDTRTGEYVTRV